MIFNTHGSSSGLPGGIPLQEEYGGGKSTVTVPHQALPPFSPRFPTGHGFRYSPPYTAQQGNSGACGGAGEATPWGAYTTQVSNAPTGDPMTAAYGLATNSRSRASTTPTTQNQQQLSAAASLSAREFTYHFSCL